MPNRACCLFLLCFFVIGSASAYDVRSRTRTPRSGTTVTKSQAVELTLTVGQAAVRPVQTRVRTAGTIDKTGKILLAYLDRTGAELVKVGQRVRAFTPESWASMYQAWITRVVPQGGRVMVEAMLTAKGLKNSRHYLMEIVVEQGQFLSVPNEAIIEEGDKHIVYVQQHPGHYVPQKIHTGVQGEMYTEVLHGLNEGDQVVTFGSFFIDAEHKLKSTEQGATSGGTSHDQHHH